MTASSSDQTLPSSDEIGAAIGRSGAASTATDLAEGTTEQPEALAQTTAAPGAAQLSVAARRAVPGWRWLTAAFLLAGAAQLITISALLSADPLAASWSALLLAIAPVLLTAVAAFTPAAVARPATVVAAAALVVGIIGGLLHTGLFFVPSLAALAVGGVRLFRGQP
jgi:hypothetical protein